MLLIDRNSISDAEKIINSILPINNKIDVMNFLANSVIYANNLNHSNWNINLDKNGKFIRFNVGQEYCIELLSDYLHVQCIKTKLKEIDDLQKLIIEYRGYSKKKKVLSKSIENVPDSLVKVPDSVGCHIRYPYVKDYLPRIQEANYRFIEYAIEKTLILPQSKAAHSQSIILFLSKELNKKIPNPSYRISEHDFYETIKNCEKKIKKISDLELEKKIKELRADATLVNVTSIRYMRSPYIAEFVKRKAKGICQDCKQSAPFVSKDTGEPYLEIHHIVPLSEGGEDSIKNTIALCPNCHRKRHYG